jgi:hypothetical protein
LKAAEPLKKVYVSHPLRGDMDPEMPNFKIIVDNKEEVDEICRQIVREFPNVLPLSPINAFSFFRIFEEDEQALKMDLRFLELADELWVFGDWQNSAGCKREIERARELAMPIRYENGDADLPKRYYCVNQLDLLGFDDDLSAVTTPARNRDDAKVRLGCTPRCECMCGCNGPVVYEEPGQSKNEENLEVF